MNVYYPGKEFLGKKMVGGGAEGGSGGNRAREWRPLLVEGNNGFTYCMRSMEENLVRLKEKGRTKVKMREKKGEKDSREEVVKSYGPSSLGKNREWVCRDVKEGINRRDKNRGGVEARISRE